MHIDFAPLEGLTDSIYRRLHHAHFPGVDRYYMPFFSPTVHQTLTHKENRELPMACSVPFAAVPQVLTKDPAGFLWAAEQCAQRGYTQVNWNIGCPSGTVVAKGKGAGMLADPDALDSFLDTVCARSPLPVSVKTRVGLADGEGFPGLLEIFNRYPLHELIIHPRTRKDFYSGPVRYELFQYAAEHCTVPLCYNGDLRSLEDIASVKQRYPHLHAVMLGRGLVADPGMLSGGTPVPKLRQFHDALLEEYIAAFGGARNAMHRMKEHWHYFAPRFPHCEKLLKRLRKTTDISEYRALTEQIFSSGE